MLMDKAAQVCLLVVVLGLCLNVCSSEEIEGTANELDVAQIDVVEEPSVLEEEAPEDAAPEEAAPEEEAVSDNTANHKVVSNLMLPVLNITINLGGEGTTGGTATATENTSNTATDGASSTSNTSETIPQPPVEQQHQQEPSNPPIETMPQPPVKQEQQNKPPDPTNPPNYHTHDTYPKHPYPFFPIFNPFPRIFSWTTSFYNRLFNSFFHQRRYSYENRENPHQNCTTSTYTKFLETLLTIQNNYFRNIGGILDNGRMDLIFRMFDLNTVLRNFLYSSVPNITEFIGANRTSFIKASTNLFNKTFANILASFPQLTNILSTEEFLEYLYDGVQESQNNSNNIGATLMKYSNCT